MVVSQDPVDLIIQFDDLVFRRPIDHLLHLTGIFNLQILINSNRVSVRLYVIGNSLYLFLFDERLINVIYVVEVGQSLLWLAVVTFSHVLQLLQDLHCVFHLRFYDASPGLAEVSLNQVDVFKGQGQGFDVGDRLDREEASRIRTVGHSHF